MQIKKFESPTMDGALKMIKEELGQDAVIVSTQNVKKGSDSCIQVMAQAPKPLIKDRGFTQTPYIQIYEGQKEVPKDWKEPPQKTPVSNLELGNEAEWNQREQKEVPKDWKEPPQKTPVSILELGNEAEWNQRGIWLESHFVLKNLIQEGVHRELAANLVEEAQRDMSPRCRKNPHLLEAWVIKYLLHSIVCTEAQKDDFYHVFVGPSGHGKTSSLVKLAAQKVMLDKASIGLVAVGQQKVGDIDALRTYAHILNIPFAHVKEPNDWPSVEKNFLSEKSDSLKEGCSDKDDKNLFMENKEKVRLENIFVDFPGAYQSSKISPSEMAAILPPETDDKKRRVHYVQSILSREDETMIPKLADLNIDDIIFTHLDECAKYGNIFNLHKKYSLALYSFGIGSKIPEDIEPATRERVVDLIFKLTKIQSKEGKK